MNPLVLLLSHLFFFFLLVWQGEAQSSFTPESSQDVVTSFKPSLAVVIGILVIMFALTFVLLVYAKCRRDRDGASANHPGQIGSSSRFSGIDKTVIESLPFFRFSSLKGSKQGLECAVCLSKFEDVEILRLIPKCKHAFHISCVDQWLEKHSSCPLCRQKVNANDPTIFTYWNSMRFSGGHSELREDSNVEVFVQREEDLRGPSSQFSFRKVEKEAAAAADQEEFSLIRYHKEEDDKSLLHKLNHQIIVSDVVFKNRWSNVSSSDLMFLKSEMLNDMSSNRFDSSGLSNNNSTISSRGIKEEMEMKRVFERKINTVDIISSDQVTIPNLPSTSDSSILSPKDRRSMSDITAVSRSGNSGMKMKINDSGNNDNVKEQRLRRLWLPIASRTVQLFANRETRTQQSLHQTTTQPPLDV